MATLRCPHKDCRDLMVALPHTHQDTIQCTGCGRNLYAVIRNGHTISVRKRSLDFDVPDGLPTDLESVLTQAIACYDADSAAGTVVLAGLIIEGLLKQIGVGGDRLVEMIEEAHKMEIISSLGFHVATASRLMRNIGAHYSPELAKLSISDARLVLEMTRKLADDVIESGRL